MTERPCSQDHKQALVADEPSALIVPTFKFQRGSLKSSEDSDMSMKDALVMFIAPES